MIFSLLLLVCLSVSIIFLGYAILMIFRNNWVYRKYSEHTNATYEYLHNLILHTSVDKNIDFCSYYNCLWDYQKMCSHFWIWDVSKMVENRKLFDEIYGKKKPLEGEK